MGKSSSIDLTTQQHLAVDLLVAGLSTHETAEQIKANVRTVQRWINDPVFASELGSRRTAIFAQASAILSRTAKLSALTLESVLNDEKSTVSQKIAVARIVLELGLKFFELETVQPRLAQLQEELEAIAITRTNNGHN
jgi:transposase